MAKRLDLFTAGALSLGTLTGDVEFLLNEVESLERADSQELRRHWEILEEVYAAAVAMHGGKVDDQSKDLVRSAVAALRTRVGDLLTRVAPDNQDTDEGGS